MLLKEYLYCLVRGHKLLFFTYRGAEYQYCLQCGKIEFIKNSQEQMPHLKLITIATHFNP